MANLKTGRRGETATRNEAMSSFRYRPPVAVGASKCGEEESDSGRSGLHSVPNPRLAASENQAERVAKLGGRTLVGARTWEWEAKARRRLEDGQAYCATVITCSGICPDV